MKRNVGSSVSRYGRVILFFLIAGYGIAPEYATALKEETSVLKGRVSSVEGHPVEGARLFIYSGSDVRRPADFISAPSDRDGLFRMILPPGKYRAVARLKKKDGFGPLMPGDKHSGEPDEIALAAGKEVTLDFTVADLKDVIKTSKKASESAVRVSGRIVDESGSPVITAYAFAYRAEKGTGIPDYLSPWADTEGRYTLYLPPGTYYFGSAAEFPPDEPFIPGRQIAVDADRSGMDIVVKKRTNPLKN